MALRLLEALAGPGAGGSEAAGRGRPYDVLQTQNLALLGSVLGLLLLLLLLLALCVYKPLRRRR